MAKSSYHDLSQKIQAISKKTIKKGPSVMDRLTQLEASAKEKKS